jgi:hypothetical protein
MLKLEWRTDLKPAGRIGYVAGKRANISFNSGKSSEFASVRPGGAVEVPMLVETTQLPCAC